MTDQLRKRAQDDGIACGMAFKRERPGLTPRGVSVGYTRYYEMPWIAKASKTPGLLAYDRDHKAGFIEGYGA